MTAVMQREKQSRFPVVTYEWSNGGCSGSG